MNYSGGKTFGRVETFNGGRDRWCGPPNLVDPLPLFFQNINSKTLNKLIPISLYNIHTLAQW
jgi:hypothetical protein